MVPLAVGSHGQNAADIGGRLQRARRKRGLTLHDIARTTKISLQSLQAMERNDFGRLPGGVFRRAYVRAFAVEVGLDADKVTREFRARFDTELFEAPADAGGTGRTRQVVIAVLLALVVLVCGILLQRAAEPLPEHEEEAHAIVDETSRVRSPSFIHANRTSGTFHARTP